MKIQIPVSIPRTRTPKIETPLNVNYVKYVPLSTLSTSTKKNLKIKAFNITFSIFRLQFFYRLRNEADDTRLFPQLITRMEIIEIT